MTFVSKQVRSESLLLFKDASAKFWSAAGFCLSLDCRTTAFEEATKVKVDETEAYKKSSATPSCAILPSLNFTIETDLCDPITIKVEVAAVAVARSAFLRATCKCSTLTALLELMMDRLMEINLGSALGVRKDGDVQKEGVEGAQVKEVVGVVHATIRDIMELASRCEATFVATTFVKTVGRSPTGYRRPYVMSAREETVVVREIQAKLECRSSGNPFEESECPFKGEESKITSISSFHYAKALWTPMSSTLRLASCHCQIFHLTSS